jgi:hypothetical protein
MIIAFLLHFAFSTFIAIVLSLMAGTLTIWIAVLSLTCGTAAALYFRRVFAGQDGPNIWNMDIAEKVIYGFIAIAGLRHFIYLVFNSADSVKILLRSNYGDMPLHINFIRLFSSGASFPPDNPIWAFDKLRYPFGIDFYNSLWDKLGVPLNIHMFAVGFILLLIAILTLRWWGGMLAVGGFFLNGGWAGWQFFINNFQTADYQDPLAWKNFFLSVFLPQRGFLIAIPIGVFLLKVGGEYLRGQRTLNKTGIFLYSFLWGILPLFHVHSFIIVSLIIGGYIVIHRRIDRVIPILVIALPLASIFILYSTNLFHGTSSMIHLKPGWMADGKIVSFWFYNLGPWLFLIVGFFIYEMITGASANRMEWILMLLLFVVFTFVIMAPWDWDNVKILIWPWIGLCRLSGISVKNLLANLHLKKLMQTAILVTLSCILFFSGSVSVFHTIRSDAETYEIFNRNELRSAREALADVSHNAVIASEPTFNNPISYWGYKLVLGYNGHLWSHGIKYQDQEKLLNDFFKGIGDWKTQARSLKIDYILWGPRERAKYGVNNNLSWRAELQNVSVIPQWELYKVSKE